jgi:hypothetical protein
LNDVLIFEKTILFTLPYCIYYVCLNQLAANVGLADPYRILHPVKREFTYIPNARMNLNRSRIDFFLTKKNQAQYVLGCNISSALSSTSFDHKKISLSLGIKKKKPDFNKIDQSLLKNRGVELLVKIKVLENYIVNADPDAVPGYLTRGLLIDIGRIESGIQDWVKNNQDPVRIEEVENIFETLPDLEFFEELPRSGSDDFFFEGLISTVRTSVLSLQAGIHLGKKQKSKKLTIGIVDPEAKLR